MNSLINHLKESTLYESIFSTKEQIISKSNRDWLENKMTGNYKIIETKTGKLKLRGRCIIKGIDDQIIPGLDITEMNGTLIITKCPNLESISRLFIDLPKGKFNIIISNNEKLKSINGLPIVFDGDLEISYNSSLESVKLPEMMKNITFVRNKIKMNQEAIKKTTNVLDEINCAAIEENTDMITEEFHSKILSDLAKQIKSQHLADKNEKNWKSELSWMPRFKKIMDDDNSKWDEIGPEDIYEFDFASKECMIMCKKVINNTTPGFIICKLDGKFSYIIKTSYTAGTMGKHEVKAIPIYTGASSTYRFSLDEILDIIRKQDKIYVILPDHDTRWRQKQDRMKARQGMIEMNEYSFKRIAQENMKRYKNILAERKAKGTDFTAIDKKVKDILNQVMEVNIKYHNDPEKYKYQTYKLKDLNELIYDMRRPSTIKKYEYIGKDGLMNLYSKYSHAVIQLKLADQRDTSYYMNMYRNTERDLQRIISKIEDILVKI